MFVTDDGEYVQYIYMLNGNTLCIVVCNDDVDKHLHKANILLWN